MTSFLEKAEVELSHLVQIEGFFEYRVTYELIAVTRRISAYLSAFINSPEVFATQRAFLSNKSVLLEERDVEVFFFEHRT